MNKLSVKTERAADVVVIQCAGRIVRGEESVLRNAVLAQKRARVLVLDLSEVEALDAGGLTLLIAPHRWTGENRIHLRLMNPRPFVYDMLSCTHLDRVLDVASFEDALAVLGGGENPGVNLAA